MQLTKPNAFITSLRNNSSLTIAQFSRFTPEIIEQNGFKHRKAAERLSTLLSSKEFYLGQYVGKNKYLYLQQINNEIREVSAEISKYPKPTTLGELNNSEPKELLIALQLLLNDLRLFFTVDNMISTDGIKSLCPLIIYEFSNLTIEEVAVCFVQAKKGHYEKLYNRLDGAVIMSWLKKYRNEKLIRLKEHNYVQDAHAKIGITQRQVASSSSLLNEARTAIEIDAALNKINKTS